MIRRSSNKHGSLKFAVGDLVWIKTVNFQLPSELSRKLAAKWLGPYPITEMVRSVACRIQLPPELGRVYPVFHVSMIKKHEGPILQQRAPLFIDGVEEYEVDQIVAKQIRRNRIEYLVSWKGYG